MPKFEDAAVDPQTESGRGVARCAVHTAAQLRASDSYPYDYERLTETIKGWHWLVFAALLLATAGLRVHNRL